MLGKKLYTENVYYAQADAQIAGEAVEMDENTMWAFAEEQINEFPPARKRIAEYLLQKARNLQEFNFREIIKKCRINATGGQNLIDETLSYFRETLGMKMFSIAREQKGGGYHLLVPGADYLQLEPDEKFEWNYEDSVYNNVVRNLGNVPEKYRELLLLLNLSSDYTLWLTYEDIIEQTRYERKNLLYMLKELKKFLDKIDIQLARIEKGKEAHIILIHRNEDEDEIYEALDIDEDEEDEIYEALNIDEDEEDEASLSFVKIIKENRERFSNLDALEIAIALGEAADNEKALLSAEDIADFIGASVEKVLKELKGGKAEVPKVLGKLGITVYKQQLTYGNREDVYSIEFL